MPDHNYHPDLYDHPPAKPMFTPWEIPFYAFLFCLGWPIWKWILQNMLSVFDPAGFIWLFQFFFGPGLK